VVPSAASSSNRSRSATSMANSRSRLRFASVGRPRRVRRSRGSGRRSTRQVAGVVVAPVELVQRAVQEAGELRAGARARRAPAVSRAPRRGSRARSRATKCLPTRFELRDHSLVGERLGVGSGEPRPRVPASRWSPFAWAACFWRPARRGRHPRGDAATPSR
jgi:hypothetical protein